MTVTIGRRELLAALGGAAAAWPLAARARQGAMPVAVGGIFSCQLQERLGRNWVCRGPQRYDRIPLGG